MITENLTLALMAEWIKTYNAAGPTVQAAMVAELAGRSERQIGTSEKAFKGPREVSEAQDGNEFIAHARTYIPKLLAEVDRLTAQREQALDALELDRPPNDGTAYGEGRAEGYAIAEEIVREVLEGGKQ